jgi:hypothetical protein
MRPPGRCVAAGVRVCVHEGGGGGGGCLRVRACVGGCSEELQRPRASHARADLKESHARARTALPRGRRWCLCPSSARRTRSATRTWRPPCCASCRCGLASSRRRRGATCAPTGGLSVLSVWRPSGALCLGASPVCGTRSMLRHSQHPPMHRTPTCPPPPPPTHTQDPLCAARPEPAHKLPPPSSTRRPAVCLRRPPRQRHL